jgi:hypothetical protein
MADIPIVEVRKVRIEYEIAPPVVQSAQPMLDAASLERFIIGVIGKAGSNRTPL